MFPSFLVFRADAKWVMHKRKFQTHVLQSPLQLILLSLRQCVPSSSGRGKECATDSGHASQETGAAWCSEAGQLLGGL